MSFEIEDIKKLYERAVLNSTYEKKVRDEKTKEITEIITRKTEAFLILSTLLEGVLSEITLVTLKKSFSKLYDNKKDSVFYSLNNIINDLYLLRVISNNEFKQLSEFKKARNKYFHTLLKQDPAELESKMATEYDNFEEIAWGMVKKLEKLYKK